MEYLTVYNQSGQMLAVLDSADKIGYELKHNDLWTGSFSLAADDPKNDFCQAHNLVKLPDGPRQTGLYRIVGMPNGEETGLGSVKTYSLEHVMATLLDDVLFGYHEVGGTGVYTRTVMQYILDRQTTTRWRLGTVDFNDQFQYHFENVSLLSALLSLGEVLADEYTWDFDTSTTPWTVNLRRADSAAGCGIHYGRNLVSITKSMDATALITRLYPLGYGEGVNQLNIKEANNNVPYIDADTIGTWGVKCSVWTDTRIQDAATLKARAQAVLEGYKNPYLSYTAKAVDLYRETGFSWDNFMPGKLVKVMDGEHGINFDARIVTISKRDVNGDPGDIEITIANAARDAADSINTLADRVGIGELYSQGATNLFAIPFADNADASHPAKFRVYIPEGMVRINKMLLSWQIAAFRAYSTGAAAGGGTTKTSTSGGGSTQTTTTNDTVVYTSEYGGDCVVSTAQRIVAKNSDGGTELIGWTFGPRDNGVSADGAVMTTTKASLSTLNTGAGTSHNHGMGHTHVINGHSHTVNSHTHGMDHYHSTYSHSHTVNSHSHGMDHYHETYSHSHTVNSHNHYFCHYHTGGSHYHQVNSHWHSVNSHWHSLPYSGATYTDGATGSTDSEAPYTDSRSPNTSWPKSNDETIYYTDDSSPGTNSASPNTTGAKQSGSDRNNTGTSSPGTDSASPNTGSPKTGEGTYKYYTDASSPGTDSVELRTLGASVGSNSKPNTDDESSHTHPLTVHSHGMDHFHRLASFTIPPLSIEIPAHGHNVRIPGHNHSVTIPAHTHDLTLPDHSHGIQYGIYEGSRASSVTIKVDGTDVPAAEIASREIDVSGYLSKDDKGKIRRGTWHEIQIVPDNLTRIEANLTAQVFVQSVGGGDY